jgi:tetratricopeptide (TPR) repeat protein
MRAEALTEIGRTHFNGRRYEAAFESFDQALRADPTFIRAQVAKAHVLKMLNRAADALALCDEVIVAHPDYATAHSTRGSALQSLGRSGEARAAYARAVDLAPDSALVAYNYACFWALEGNAAESQKWLTKAIDLEPGRNTRAAIDPDFTAFRDADWFQQLIAFKR